MSSLISGISQKISTSRYLYIGFDAAPMMSSILLWHCNQNAAEHKGATDEQEFLRKFAVGIPGCVTFEKIDFDKSSTVECNAERYGGVGIGTNGGGVRCAVIGDFVVKGIGQNPLVGSDTDIHHTYGGFKANYAVHETIYSGLLCKLLPIGTVPVIGTILTGSQAAFVKGLERGWGGLIVRERAARPASLLRAGWFKPDCCSSMMSDVVRVRNVNRVLMQLLENSEAASVFFTEFLENCAKQFACARAFRLTHGALTPSNLSLDGRWMDLTNTSFTSSGENIAGGNRKTPSFYEELDAPLVIAREMLDTFEKYTGTSLNFRRLATGYRRALSKNLGKEIARVFGIDHISHDRLLCHDILSKFTNEIFKILTSGPIVFDRWPEHLRADDPIIVTIENCFSSLMGDAVVEYIDFMRKVCPNLNPATLLDCFRKIINSLKATLPGDIDGGWYLCHLYVAAIKKAVLTEYFFKVRMERIVGRLMDASDISTLSRFMDETICFGAWVFSDQNFGGESLEVLKFPGILITYKFYTAELSIIDHRTSSAYLIGQQTKISSVKPVCDLLQLHGFDFIPYVERVVTMIFRLTGNECRTESREIAA